MAVMEESEKQYSIRFVSQDKRIEQISSAPIDVPAELDSAGLNELVNLNAKSSHGDWTEVPLSFLIGGVLLKSSLEEFVTTHSLPTESVLDVECILQEPAPIPDKNFDDDDWVAAVHVTPTCIVSVNYGGTLRVWSHEGTQLATHKFSGESLRCVDALKIGTDDAFVCGGENQTLAICMFASNKLQPAILLRGHERSVECVAAKGTQLVSGSFDKCLKVWSIDDDATTFEQHTPDRGKKTKLSTMTKVPNVTLEHHRDVVTDVCWHPMEANHAVSVSWDQNIIVTDVEAGAVSATLSCNKAHSRLSVHASTGTVLTASMDAIIRLWDLRSKDEYMVKQRFRGHSGIVSDVRWSPTSDHLFVSSSFDKSVRMWDTRSPTAPLYEITGHNDHVLAVDWSIDSVIASAGKDSTIKTYRRG